MSSNLPKNQQIFFSRISAQASKKRSNQKNKGTYTTNWRILFWLLRTLLFWFDLFLEARVEILEKVSLVFWEIWRHQKDILKLTDLYKISNVKLTPWADSELGSLSESTYKLNYLFNGTGRYLCVRQSTLLGKLSIFFGINIFSNPTNSYYLLKIKYGNEP